MLVKAKNIMLPPACPRFSNVIKRVGLSTSLLLQFSWFQVCESSAGSQRQKHSREGAEVVFMYIFTFDPAG